MRKPNPLVVASELHLFTSMRAETQRLTRPSLGSGGALAPPRHPLLYIELTIPTSTPLWPSMPRPLKADVLLSPLFIPRLSAHLSPQASIHSPC
jgi:hypothetical protein